MQNLPVPVHSGRILPISLQRKTLSAQRSKFGQPGSRCHAADKAATFSVGARFFL